MLLASDEQDARLRPTFLEHTVPKANSAKAERASLYSLHLDPSTGVLCFPSY